MPILITSGNGYVGRTLIRMLADGRDVTMIGNLRSGRPRLAEDEFE